MVNKIRCHHCGRDIETDPRIVNPMMAPCEKCRIAGHTSSQPCPECLYLFEEDARINVLPHLAIMEVNIPDDLYAD